MVADQSLHVKLYAKKGSQKVSNSMSKQLEGPKLNLLKYPLNKIGSGMLKCTVWITKCSLFYPNVQSKELCSKISPMSLNRSLQLISWLIMTQSTLPEIWMTLKKTLNPADSMKRTSFRLAMWNQMCQQLRILRGFRWRLKLDRLEKWWTVMPMFWTILRCMIINLVSWAAYPTEVAAIIASLN